MVNQTDLGTTERVAVVTAMLLSGESPTTRQIAEHLSISRQGAHSLLLRIARVLPTYQDEGRWHVLREDDVTII